MFDTDKVLYFLYANRKPTGAGTISRAKPSDWLRFEHGRFRARRYYPISYPTREFPSFSVGRWDESGDKNERNMAWRNPKIAPAYNLLFCRVSRCYEAGNESLYGNVPLLPLGRGKKTCHQVVPVEHMTRSIRRSRLRCCQTRDSGSSREGC